MGCVALSPNAGEYPQGWILKALTRLLLRSQRWLHISSTENIV
jgi:hypothetical protein